MIMGLRDIGASLPPGFRFYPSDEELVCHYLSKKVSNDQHVFKGTLVEIDLHTCEPWQLPEVAKLNATEWYFFSFRDRKYATGYRTNRATISGYWKATGKDRTVVDPTRKEVVGMRKTLVFYRNRAPNGIKTGWIMHEFRLESPHMPPKEDWVLCRVFHKSKTTEDYNNNYNNINKFSPPPNYHLDTHNYHDATTPLITTNLDLPQNNPTHNGGGNLPGMTTPAAAVAAAAGNHHNQVTSLSSSTITGHRHQSCDVQAGSFLNLLQDHHNNNNNHSEISSKPSNHRNNAEDQFGFLWNDVSLEETCSLGDGASDFDDMPSFEIDHSNMVFL